MSALVGLTATVAAQADITTIDADPYASSTDVSTVFEGVTLSHLTWNGGAYQASAVHSTSCGTAPSPICNPVGFAMFGWQTPTGTYSSSWVSPGMSNVATCLVDPTQTFCSSPAQHILELSFDTDTDFVQFNATYTNYAPDVLAFDAAGNAVTVTPQVTVVQTYISGAALKLGHRVVTVNAPSANIKRLWIAGSGGNSQIDGISFGRPATTCPVEEPSQ